MSYVNMQNLRCSGRYQRTETPTETRNSPGGSNERGASIQGSSSHQSQLYAGEYRERYGEHEGMSEIRLAET